MTLVVALYWRIGQEINARRKAEGWGSTRNLKYAAQFAAAWPQLREHGFGQQGEIARGACAPTLWLLA